MKVEKSVKDPQGFGDFVTIIFFDLISRGGVISVLSEAVHM